MHKGPKSHYQLEISFSENLTLSDKTTTINLQQLTDSVNPSVRLRKPELQTGCEKTVHNRSVSVSSKASPHFIVPHLTEFMEENSIRYLQVRLWKTGIHCQFRIIYGAETESNRQS